MFYKTARATQTVADSISVDFTHPESPLQRSQSGNAGCAPGIRASREEYAVADFVGRCFLRACCWYDICTSWTRKHDPAKFKASTSQRQSVRMIGQSAITPVPMLEVRSTIATTGQTKP
jgi:hypothetical protein